MAYWHFVSPLGWPGFHPHRSIIFCLLSDLGLNLKLDTNNVFFSDGGCDWFGLVVLGGVPHPLLGLRHRVERFPDCHQVKKGRRTFTRIDHFSTSRFIHLLWVNFKAKWNNQTVGELFLKTAERLPDKVSSPMLSSKV